MIEAINKLRWKQFLAANWTSKERDKRQTSRQIIKAAQRYLKPYKHNLSRTFLRRLRVPSRILHSQVVDKPLVTGTMVSFRDLCLLTVPKPNQKSSYRYKVCDNLQRKSKPNKQVTLKSLLLWSVLRASVNQVRQFMIRQLWRFLKQRLWIPVKNASKSKRMNSVKHFKLSMKQLYKKNIKSKKSYCWRLLQYRKRTKSYSQSYSEYNLTRIIWILRRMLILYLCATTANKHRQ